jgi:hypothetical protein
MHKVIASLIGLALISARVQAQSEIDRVLLERTLCLGSCPVYTVEIRASGLVTFTGKAYVRKMSATRKLSPGVFRSVVSRFRRAGFFGLEPSYGPGQPGCKRGVTDAPSASLALTDHGRSKTVSFYYGCFGDSPNHDSNTGRQLVGAFALLDSLTIFIDSVAGTDEWAPTHGPRTKPVHHYVFIGREREVLRQSPAFLDNKIFEGVQITYPWAKLEHAKDEYDFSAIRDDITLLKSKNKKLWIQFSDVSFSSERTNVPRYLTTDSTYHGGVAMQYSIPGDDESKAKPTGFVARRWDPAVQDRLQKLFFALGREFDGQIEGINLPETAITFGSSGKLRPPGFKPEEYPAAVITDLTALKRAFPKSVAMQYANFMPGEWRPTEDKLYLSRVYGGARRVNVGLGGPDLMPYRPGQLGSSYPLIRLLAGTVPTGIAVQDGNLEEINPDTHKPVTVSELLDFALNNLKVDYIFWGTQEPYFTRDVIPTLTKQGHTSAKITSDGCGSRDCFGAVSPCAGRGCRQPEDDSRHTRQRQSPSVRGDIAAGLEGESALASSFDCLCH